MAWKTLCRRTYDIDKTGFTTVELIVTVGVLVVLTAVSMPVVNSFAPSYNAKQAASHIVSHMQFARIHAVKNRVATVVAFYPESYIPADQANSFLIYEDSNNNWVQDPGENILLSRTYMPAKVNLLSAAFTSNGSGEPTETTSCGFDSQGIAARTGATYVIGNVALQNSKGQTRTISLNASGKTKILMP
jgi:type IV fimbrial biogenesis protein FimT